MWSSKCFAISWHFRSHDPRSRVQDILHREVARWLLLLSHSNCFRQQERAADVCSLFGLPADYCAGFLCTGLCVAGAAVVTGLPFLSSRMPSVMVIMNGVGV